MEFDAVLQLCFATPQSVFARQAHAVKAGPGRRFMTSGGEPTGLTQKILPAAKKRRVKYLQKDIGRPLGLRIGAAAAGESAGQHFDQQSQGIALVAMVEPT